MLAQSSNRRTYTRDAYATLRSNARIELNPSNLHAGRVCYFDGHGNIGLRHSLFGRLAMGNDFGLSRMYSSIRVK
jgi:hypothetical protein